MNKCPECFYVICITQSQGLLGRIFDEQFFREQSRAISSSPTLTTFFRPDPLGGSPRYSVFVKFLILSFSLSPFPSFFLSVLLSLFFSCFLLLINYSLPTSYTVPFFGLSIFNIYCFSFKRPFFIFVSIKFDPKWQGKPHPTAYASLVTESEFPIIMCLRPSTCPTRRTDHQAHADSHAFLPSFLPPPPLATTFASAPSPRSEILLFHF